MAHKLRSDTVVKFVGNQCEIITGARLPTIRQVLAAFYYQLRTEKLPIRASARKAIKQVLCYWEKTKIPIQQEIHCIAKVESLHAELSAICKHTSRTNSKAQAKREALFCDKLDTLFDVAKSSAIPEMEKSAQREKDPAMKQAFLEDIQFLKDQKGGHRIGSIAGIDGVLAGKVQKKLIAEQRKKEKQKLLEERRKKSEAQSSIATANAVEFSSSSEDSEDTEDEAEYRVSKQSSRRGTQNVVTPELAQALDAAKVSADSATVILAAAAKSFSVDLETTNINRSTIHREREKRRSKTAQQLMENFDPADTLTIHWDGKMVNSLEGRDLVDRQAVLVTGKSTTQLLGVPFLEKGTGKAIGESVVELIKKWSLTDRIKAMSFDTTSVNTGWKNGAASFIERQLEKNLLWLPCRHHILELVLESVYHTVMGPTTGPDITVFKQFQGHWDTIEKDKYEVPSKSDFPQFLRNRVSQIASFAENSILLGQPRDDYLEFLELTIIFLGHVPPRGIQFRAPGPVHNARWMARAIYSLKVYLFRSQFPHHKNISGLLSVCVFIVGVYVEAWFSAPFATSAPRSDLKLMADLREFALLHPEASSAAQRKFSGHLWYLSEELVGLSVFDTGLSFEEREKIIESITTRQGSDDPAKKRNVTELGESLDELTTTNTAEFFKVLGIDTDFFDKPAKDWSTDIEYQKGEDIVSHLKVVNDHAERAIKLMQDYNRNVTQKETHFQNLLLNVEDFRKKLPNKQKESLRNFVG